MESIRKYWALKADKGDTDISHTSGQRSNIRYSPCADVKPEQPPQCPMHHKRLKLKSTAASCDESSSYHSPSRDRDSEADDASNGSYYVPTSDSDSDVDDYIATQALRLTQGRRKSVHRGRNPHDRSNRPPKHPSWDENTSTYQPLLPPVLVDKDGVPLKSMLKDETAHSAMASKHIKSAATEPLETEDDEVLYEPVEHERSHKQRYPERSSSNKKLQSVKELGQTIGRELRKLVTKKK